MRYRVIIIWYFCNIMAADCRFSLHPLIGSTSSLLHPVIRSWQTQAFSIHHYTLIQWQHCLQGTGGGLCWHSNAVSPKLHWTLIFWCRLWQHVCLPMYLPSTFCVVGWCCSVYIALHGPGQCYMGHCIHTRACVLHSIWQGWQPSRAFKAGRDGLSLERWWERFLSQTLRYFWVHYSLLCARLEWLLGH